MTNPINKIRGVGLGLRNEFIAELVTYHTQSLNQSPNEQSLSFIELAPENWIGIGGKYRQQLLQISSIYPMIAHGLSLSLGSPAPLNFDFLLKVKNFLRKYKIDIFSEHISYCSDNIGYLYNLLPLPFTVEAAIYISKRIKQVQDILERQIAVENIAYYLQPKSELSEIEFIKAVLSYSDCALLLDVNNVYINSVNHEYDPQEFIRAIPQDRIAYIHVGGHFKRNSKLLIDSHSSEITPEVYKLLEFTYKTKGTFPTLIERDDEVPPLATLLQEVNAVKKLFTAAKERQNHAQKAIFSS